MSSGFNIREAKPEDLNFILGTIYDSMKRESSLGRLCTTRVFAKDFREVIDYILSVSKTIIACDIEEENAILGYLIFQPEVIHYAFTKFALRRLGIAKALVKRAMPEKKVFTFSLYTKSAKQILETHQEFIFNPFVLYKRAA